MRFEIRPAGRGAPRIDPKPILDGWKLLESTAIYRSAKRNPFFGEDAEKPSIGQILLMSKQALQRHVLRNPQIDIYECGRHDVATGQVDRRVLATLEFLAASGLKPTVTSMRCGHGYYTAGGNVSEHSSGNAVDIAAINGITITPATQGAGSITDLTVQRLLTLQGTMKPHQIISLMTFEGTDNTYAMGDHGDHIHVGFRPTYDANSKAARRMAAVLKPDQWIKLIDRISEIDNPVVREQPSEFSVAVTKPASPSTAASSGSAQRVRSLRVRVRSSCFSTTFWISLRISGGPLALTVPDSNASRQLRTLPSSASSLKCERGTERRTFASDAMSRVTFGPGSSTRKSWMSPRPRSSSSITSLSFCSAGTSFWKFRTASSMRVLVSAVDTDAGSYPPPWIANISATSRTGRSQSSRSTGRSA